MLAVPPLLLLPPVVPGRGYPHNTLTAGLSVALLNYNNDAADVVVEEVTIEEALVPPINVSEEGAGR